jgi:hypothetical protein
MPTRNIQKAFLEAYKSRDLGYENHPTLYTRQGHNGIEGQDILGLYEDRGYGRQY